MIFLRYFLISASLIVYIISQYVTADIVLDCLSEMIRSQLDDSIVDSCKNNIHIGPKEYELQNQGLDFLINYHIKRYGYQNNKQSYVVDYKIIVFFYQFYFINDPVTDESEVLCPNPTTFCNHYQYYEEVNFQVHNFKNYESCFNDLTLFYHNDSNIPAFENINLGPPLDQIFPYASAQLMAFFMVENYGLNPDKRTFSNFYKIYLTLYEINVQRNIPISQNTTGASSSSAPNTTGASSSSAPIGTSEIINPYIHPCAYPSTFCKHLHYYKKTKFIPMALTMYNACLANLKMYFRDINTPGIDIINTKSNNIEYNLTNNGLNFNLNFNNKNYGLNLSGADLMELEILSKNYGYKLTAGFITSYLIYLYYYKIHIYPKSSIFTQKLASPSEFCFSYNIYESLGFRTTVPQIFNDCIGKLCDGRYKFDCRASKEDILYNETSGPSLIVLINKGLDIDNLINQDFKSLHRLHYGQEYKILLIYFKKIVMQKIMLLSIQMGIILDRNLFPSIYFPSPLEFCYDYFHYKKIGLKIPASILQ